MAQQAEHLTPRANALVAPLSNIVLSLILLLIFVLLSHDFVSSSIDSTKSSILDGCRNTESAASVATSLPHYTAAGLNNLAASGAEESLKAVAHVYIFSLTALQSIIVFIIEIYRATTLCLGELVVRSSLGAAIDATQTAEDFMSDASRTVAQQLTDAMNSVNNAISSVGDTINNIPGVDIDIPNLDTTSLDSLQNISVPSTVSDSLQSLNSSIPSVDQLRGSIENALDIPFSSLRNDIESNLANASVDRSLFPIPQQNAVQFCSDLDLGSVDDVADNLLKMLKIVIAIIAGLLAIIIIFQIWWEYRATQKLHDFVQQTHNDWSLNFRDLNNPTLPSHSNILDFISYCQYLTPHKFIINHSSSLSKQTQTDLHWLINIIFHKRPQTFLSIGLTTFLAVQAQLIALNIIKNNSVDLAAQSLDNFDNAVRNQINTVVLNQTSQWADGTNQVLLDFQDNVNNDVFGWVNTTTETLNETLNVFYDGITNAINETFGTNSVIGSIAVDVVDCIIGNKIQNIQTALTFLQENAQISIPQVDAQQVSLSDNSVNELVARIGQPQQQQASSTAASSTARSVVNTLASPYEKLLKKQRISSFILLGLWGFVVLCAILVLLCRRFLPQSVRSFFQNSFSKFKSSLSKSTRRSRRTNNNNNNSNNKKWFSLNLNRSTSRSRPRSQTNRSSTPNASTLRESMSSDGSPMISRPMDSKKFAKNYLAKRYSLEP